MNLGIRWAVKEPAGGPFKSGRRRLHFSAAFEGAFEMGQPWRPSVTQAVLKSSLQRMHPLNWDSALVSAQRIGMPRLTDLDRARVIGQLQASLLQIQVAALFGVSSGNISKGKAKFHIAGDVRQDTKWASQEDDTPRRWFPHSVSTTGMLPRQFGTDCTQPIPT